MKYYEVKFSISSPSELRQDVKDIVAALAGEAGFESFEDDADGDMVGYVQQSAFDANALWDTLTALPFPEVKVEFAVSEAEDKDWNEQWEKEGFEPILVNGHVLIHDGRHLPPTLPADVISIEIDAHLAFGTGNHATTRLMVAHLLQSDLRGRRVLDCGTGTGILAIAALKLGAAEATGYDIDEWSADNARHNAVINCVDDRFQPLLGDAQMVIPKLDGHFDVILANINRNILLADMPLFVSRLATGGKLLLSGFYREDMPLLVARAEELGLSLYSETHEDEWQSLAFRYN